MMLSFRLGRTRPTEQEDEPSAAPVLGVDYDEYVDPHTQKTGAAKHIFARSFHEPTGVLLTPETLNMARAAAGDHDPNAAAAMTKLVNYRYPQDDKGRQLPMPESDKQHIAAAVRDVFTAISHNQKAMTTGPEEKKLQVAFLSRLKEASRQAGRDKFDFLTQFGRMSPRLQNMFTSEECEALGNPEWRAGIIEDIRAYEQLRTASQALRREAIAIVGEDLIRAVPVTTEQRSSGRITSHDHHAKSAQREHNGGYGCTRANGGRSFGNDRASFDR